MTKPAELTTPSPAITTAEDVRHPTLSQSAARFVAEQPLVVVGIGLVFGFALGRALSK